MNEPTDQPPPTHPYLDVPKGGVVPKHLAVDEADQVLLHLLGERRLRWKWGSVGDSWLVRREEKGKSGQLWCGGFVGAPASSW